MLVCYKVIILLYMILKNKRLDKTSKLLSEEEFEEVNPDQIIFAQGCRKGV